MKNCIQQIHQKQLKTFVTLDKFHNNKAHLQILPRKRRGLYWFWTKVDDKILKTAAPRVKSKEVPIDKLVNQRLGFKHICNISKSSYTIVYNGIGGYKKEPAAFGLRERINQEISCNDFRTGTLNIINRNFKKKDWAVSFFDFDAIENQEIVNLLGSKNPYLDFAKDIETLWRLEYGTPILCRY